jgi:imidazoleglycerol phosphate synthase glutamine amidotransferase subunit HisH
MGWNRVRAIGNGWAWPRPEGDAYFANSYRLERGGEAAVGWSVMTGEYGGEFVAAMARGRVLACQFHPELSGAFGREMLDAWLGVARC